VHAEIAVAQLQGRFQIAKGQYLGGSQGAEDPQPYAIVDEAIELLCVPGLDAPRRLLNARPRD
jgi:hypothetical protein